MNTLWKWTGAVSLTGMLCASSGMAAPVASPVDDCVSSGTTKQVYWAAVWDVNPVPDGLQFLPGTAEGYEQDAFDDDKIGPAVVVPASNAGDPGEDRGRLCLPIKAVGGSLYGPNGDKLTGPVEGSCIEVYVKVKVRWKVEICETRTVSATGGGLGASGSVQECYTAWRSRTIRTDVKKVCACD